MQAQWADSDSVTLALKDEPVTVRDMDFAHTEQSPLDRPVKSAILFHDAVAWESPWHYDSRSMLQPNHKRTGITTEAAPGMRVP